VKTFEEAITTTYDNISTEELTQLMHVVRESPCAKRLLASLAIVALIDPLSALIQGIAIGSMIGKEMYLEVPQNLGVKSDA
jgi:hypothetical protein